METTVSPWFSSFFHAWLLRDLSCVPIVPIVGVGDLTCSHLNFGYFPTELLQCILHEATSEDCLEITAGPECDNMHSFGHLSFCSYYIIAKGTALGSSLSPDTMQRADYHL